MKFYKLLFFSALIFGSLMAISSYSWLSMWIGLEINLLSIIPLLSNIKNLYPSEAALKYFLAQAMASSIFLFAMILLTNLNETMFSSTTLILALNSALLMKMGAAPFHFWFPEVLEGLNWINSMIMLTWQKLAPMVILSYSSKLALFISIIIIMSSLTGGLMGLTQISLRKILAFSSINHISWMLASMMLSSPVWMNYFLIYSLITVNLVLIFHKMNLLFINQMNLTLQKQKITKISVMMNLFSLGGLPPFLGFFPKWITISTLAENKLVPLIVLMVILTLVTLFFYMRICFSALLMNSLENNVSQNNKIPNSLAILNFSSLISLILGPVVSLT
nr:NADH dehydrogenase subunit 2 [Clytomelegena kabakovi]